MQKIMAKIGIGNSIKIIGSRQAEGSLFKYFMGCVKDFAHISFWALNLELELPINARLHVMA